MDRAGLALWDHLVEVVRQHALSNDPDLRICTLEANGKYSVKSFYSQINFGGVVSTFGDNLWKVISPQKIHVFLWLCIYNKVLTRDNLGKYRPVEHSTCLFAVVKNLYNICSLIA